MKNGHVSNFRNTIKKQEREQQFSTCKSSAIHIRNYSVEEKTQQDDEWGGLVVLKLLLLEGVSAS